MLKRGLYCLMKFCSASSASASVWTTSASMWSIMVDQIAPAARRRIGEVRRDPLADRVRLADVQHLAARVAEQVDARLVGELAALVGRSYRHLSSRIGGALTRTISDSGDPHQREPQRDQARAVSPRPSGRRDRQVLRHLAPRDSPSRTAVGRWQAERVHHERERERRRTAPPRAANAPRRRSAPPSAERHGQRAPAAHRAIEYTCHAVGSAGTPRRARPVPRQREQRAARTGGSRSGTATRTGRPRRSRSASRRPRPRDAARPITR